jgi:1-aminocyclopropane-1-carboxylate deaminase/D-cysteine desulfhydrase-like pyridoxal-dependent ACC family enzyme
MDSTVPRVRIERTDFELLTDYLGEGYGAVTKKGREAVERISGKLSLETTYTGKTLAACIEYCENTNPDDHILFWNSFNSFEFKRTVDLYGLPEPILQKLSL